MTGERGLAGFMQTAVQVCMPRCNLHEENKINLKKTFNKLPFCFVLIHMQQCGANVVLSKNGYITYKPMFS